jgi:hypothetical protein
MSPQKFSSTAGDAVSAAVRRLWVELGSQVREARLTRQRSVVATAARAGVSRTVAYQFEAGQPTSLEAAVRLASALGLRIEIEAFDPRRKRGPSVRSSDPVHSVMGEFEAGHLRALRRHVGIDEPYQHYQFAGRGDVVAWDEPAGAFLHIENRTRFPDLQEIAGSFNSKRAYLATAIAQRLGVRGWASETHVIAVLWSAEVLHTLRLRPETFRSLCPDPPDACADWWSGHPPRSGSTSTLVVLDPLASGRQLAFIGLERAIAGAPPRHRGYADAAVKLMKRR